jgi:hypothetical protein
MPKLQKSISQGDHFRYEAEVTEEQVEEFKLYADGKIEEPEWFNKLKFTLIDSDKGQRYIEIDVKN